MGEDIYMYTLSPSLGSESMNRANMPIRREAAVNAINASLQLLQLENKRYDQFKKEVWGHTQPLTPREMKLMEDIFQDVEVNEYYCDELVMDTYDDCDVSRLVMNSTIYTVKIPKVSTNGSRFGTCTCGIPKLDGIPCVHMIFLAKGGHIEDPGFTRLSVMPFWLPTNCWRQQFPEDSMSRGNIAISSIKSKYSPDDVIRYCPDWAAPKKANCPKKDSGCKHGVMDAIKNAGQIKRRKIMW